MGVDIKRNLWYIHGKAYNLEPFVQQHPGGPAILGMVKGLNATELFESYHFKRKPPPELMAKFEVKVDPSTYTPEEKSKLLDERFYFEEDGFYADVKKRVQKHFQENGIPHRASTFYKVLLPLQFAAIAVTMIYSFVYGSILATVLYGITRGVTAVTAGHTMSHFSLYPGGVNYWIMRLAAPFILSHVEIWSTSHVISHHIYTLTPDDLQDNYPLKRIQPIHPWKPWHRFQHLYIWPIYAIGLPVWTFVDFVSTFPTLFTGRHEMRRFSIPQRIENCIVFTLNIYFTIYLPFAFNEFYKALFISFLANAVASAIVVIQISVNHEVPECMAQVPLDCKLDWGVHQVLTSHDYGVKSKFFLHLSGGLNLQIEHHLFPGIHYRHYYDIVPIVKQACKDYNLPYHESSSLWEAVKKHYAILKFNSTK